ncbi:MAG: VUT family protein [Candidatus Hydrogenedentes bacterium]|nr:VUT family protein [Candidatus Hydrogenedentota bacterium]
MSGELFILIAEAMTVYVLVLLAHSLRSRAGLSHFYALLGGLTAVMSWVTDAGVTVEVAGVSFMVGSTVFYTSLLLGVFVVYVFDGPRATRVAISTVVGVSIMVPIIAVVLHLQMDLSGSASPRFVPVPGLRINVASVLATLADLVFLAVAWEILGKPGWRVPLWLRSFLTLLGVMWLDVLLFATGAFLGTPDYLNIMEGTLLSRLIICAFAFPLLYLYLKWQNSKAGIDIVNRPVLAILMEITEVRGELNVAQKEIERRKAVERDYEVLIEELRRALAEVKTLRGFLPACSHCKKIRDDQGRWHSIELYIEQHSEARVSHGICPGCMVKHYSEYVLDDEVTPKIED